MVHRCFHQTSSKKYKRMKNNLSRILVFFIFINCYLPSKLNAQNINLGKAATDGGFKMENYWVWGSSVVKAEDGKYHMFASRWPKYLPFHPGWMIASEIVRAESLTPEGPYEFKEVVLPARGAQYWDGRSTHNPKIVKCNDTYVLYYMGSTHPFADFTADNAKELTLQSKHCIVGRWRKRMGIATSKSINGPWKRSDQPILDVKPKSFYSFFTSNPSPVVKDNGEVLVIFKGRGYNGHKHAAMNVGLAKADSYKGPYKVVGDAPFFSENKLGVIEDPNVWRDDKGYHMLAKDHRGSITGERGAGLLAHSDNGEDWVLNKNPKAYSKTIQWDNGQVIKMGQIERPFVLVENGKATHLFFATMDGPGEFENATKSWNMVIPLNQ